MRANNGRMLPIGGIHVVMMWKGLFRSLTRFRSMREQAAEEIYGGIVQIGFRFYHDKMTTIQNRGMLAGLSEELDNYLRSSGKNPFAIIVGCVRPPTSLRS